MEISDRDLRDRDDLDMDMYLGWWMTMTKDGLKGVIILTIPFSSEVEEAEGRERQKPCRLIGAFIDQK